MSQKITLGVVTSNKMNKTIVVAIQKQVSHKKYGKIIRKTNKYYAHDEHNVCKIGDTVQIQETRPLSKHKNWILMQVIKTK